MLKNYKYYLGNLDCANCAKKIEEKINNDKRFHNCVVNFNLLTLNFKTEIENPFMEILKLVKSVEPEVLIYQEKREQQKKDFELIRLILAIIIFIITFFMRDSSIKSILIITIYLLLLYKPFKKTIKKIIETHFVDENFLIIISAIGAYFLREYIDGIMVVMLYSIGKILEDKAVHKSRSEIQNVLDLKIDYANLWDGTTFKKVKSEELKVNDIIIVRKGEIIPVDGIIVEGESFVDTSSLTGESVLQKVGVSSNVLSGSINKGEILKIKVTHPYYHSTAYKIFELTLNATNHKANRETKISKMASYYTPVILFISIFLGIFLPVFTHISYSESIYRALTFLVISCPCAIAISVPLSYFAGIGACSKENILVKGSNILDILPQCDQIVFDKTGTITTGSFKLQKTIIYNDEFTEKEVLNIVGIGEVYSNHPLAKVILNEVHDELEEKKIKNFKEIEGKGISYEYNGKNIKVGSQSFVSTDKDGTMFLSINDELIASFIFDDSIKENAYSVIQALKKQNIKTTMFTGDNHSFAELVAKKVDLDAFESELLPNQKFTKLKSLMQNHKVIFVGDGINDTPSLVQADVGISMGKIGTNSAVEASDIVIMNDNLEGILKVLKISRKTNTIIMMNLIFAIATKLLVLVLATLGYANMAWAVFADTGVTLITILNTLRILK